ncbi:MAG: DNA photolyase family protein [Lentisphaeraceae bacterium]|nr:DNA photolyase family protein [Lentisphaeraceae bacterium]
MKKAAFWFRRDLRFEDNHGLYQALKDNDEVLPVFIFDPKILDQLTDKKDKRVDFIHQTLNEMDAKLREMGHAGILIVHGDVKAYWQKIIKMYEIETIYCNSDYESAATKRDWGVDELANSMGARFETFKDQVIFEEEDILKADGSPYTVFTPYKKRWLENYTPEHSKPFESEKLLDKMWKGKLPEPYTLKRLGFEKTDLDIPKQNINFKTLKDYDETRDFPALDSTSRLSIHLRFGTVSPRALVSKAQETNQTWLSELIWREFFMMILYHFPESEKREFKEKYSAVPWRHDEEDFKKWCFGQTGYPMVDAGMRELNATGFMHNRVRMVVASFLVKHLLIDWRWGERYFAKKLLDYDLSANVGNWQWAAGCGCDAAPYFRVFNPESQMKKFDKNQEYIKKWVPEYGTLKYAQPMIDHKEGRQRALDTYGEALGKS